jgi:hypothetical protein
MQGQPANARALLEPTADNSYYTSTDQSATVETEFEENAKSTAKNYWYLQVLVAVFMVIHVYTVVMLCICPLGNATLAPHENATWVADGYGQCLHGGIVPTPWSLTGWQGWTNVTLNVSEANAGWWKGVVVISVFVISLSLFVASYLRASLSDPGYVTHLSKNDEVSG